jgi:hypothetical protein
MSLTYLNMRKNCSGIAPVRQLRPKNSSKYTIIVTLTLSHKNNLNQKGGKNIWKPDSAKETAIQGQHGYSLLVLIYREDKVLNKNIMAQSNTTLPGEKKFLWYPNCNESKI